MYYAGFYDQDQDVWSNSTSTISHSEVNSVLKYIIPVVSAISIPMSLTNLLIFLNMGFLTSPSNIIYFNMVVMDLLNAITGILVTYDIVEDVNSTATGGSGTRGDKEQSIEKYLFRFTFDANIILVFSLALIRILWVQLSALNVLHRLTTTSYIGVIAAYLYGAFCCTYNAFAKVIEHRKTIYVMEVTDWIECFVIVLAIAMSVYTHIRMNRSNNNIESRIYISAATTSFIITLTYSYFFILNIARKASQGHDVRVCPDRWKWTFLNIFLCDSLYLGVLFMCIQSLVNSGVLLTQKQTRRYFLEHLRLCCRDTIKRICCECHDDNEFEYHSF